MKSHQVPIRLPLEGTTHGEPLTLHYTRSGHGPPLVLVHGLGLSHAEWVKNIHHFEQHATVYAVDLPGFGASDNPSRVLNTRELAEAVHCFLAVLQLDTVLCMGHSLGGNVCLWLAYLYPQRVKALVLAATPGSDPAPSPWARMPRLLVDTALEPLSFMPRLLSAYARARPVRTLQTLYASDVNAILRNPRRITQPVLLVNGRYDLVVRLQEGNLWKQRLPRARLCIIPAAHGLNFDNPRAFHDCCTPFLLNNL